MDAVVTAPPTEMVVVFNSRNWLVLRRSIGGSRWSFWPLELDSVRVDRKGRSVIQIGGASESVLFKIEDVAMSMIRIEDESWSAPEVDGFEYSSFTFRELWNASHSDGDFAYLRSFLEALRPELSKVPYLNFGRHDFIYRFRSDRERNSAAYTIDADSASLYQSRICALIKAAKRQKENSAGSPAEINFGALQYVIPSHFGFCLGVQNAIERAYETLAANPGKRVFMLSELIHNPFVNEDLQNRGLRYLQSDKGKPAIDAETGKLSWDTLSSEDVVIIPAFGATREDKARLVEHGLSISENDATCMLVEKVWKAAARFGEAGYTIIVHGKAEHEETKATFSHASQWGPSLTIRNFEEALVLEKMIRSKSAAERRSLLTYFAGRHSVGFDPSKDLEKIAFVNQTTLLRNETLKIISHFRELFTELYGPEGAAERVNGKGQGDTLCYATQVNQDALHLALACEVDFAFVVGGKNSSNTYQLFRVCETKLGESAYFIQNEKNIEEGVVQHYVFPQNPKDRKQGKYFSRDFVFAKKSKELGRPLKILVTGGASCPDGIIQQVISRINRLVERDGTSLREANDVLGDFEGACL
ncbi:MAG: 4-hydroxy-3-methylbut-2-enyl diphosphate reductase [Verrucomicrobiota bacterium]